MPTLLPLVAACLYAVSLALLCALHAGDRGVHWVADPVSRYAVGPAARLFRVYGHAGTTGAAVLALLFATAPPSRTPAVVPVSMALLVLARIGVIAVPTDAKGHATSRRGRLHLLLAVAVFALSYTAIASATPLFAGSALFPGLRATQIVAMVSLTLVVVTMAPVAKRLFGLAERVFLVSTMAWFLQAALALGMRST